MQSEVDFMDLGHRCARIRELDKMTESFDEERDRLYHAGLSDEEYNILYDLVRSDGKHHFGN